MRSIFKTKFCLLRNFISEYITGFHRHRRKLVCRIAQLAVTVSLLGLLALHLVQYTNIEELSTGDFMNFSPANVLKDIMSTLFFVKINIFWDQQSENKEIR